MKSLRTGINNYMTVFNAKDIPKTLRGQKYRIFANIKSIYKLHAYEFLPALNKCYDDPEQIADVFTSYVTREFFYGYIIYAINRKRSELLCNYHVGFWKVTNQSFHFYQVIFLIFPRKFKTLSATALESIHFSCNRFKDYRGISSCSTKSSKTCRKIWKTQSKQLPHVA